MNCGRCTFYTEGYLWNHCDVAEMEYFNPVQNCDLVNDDMTINYNSAYFANEVKQEAECE